VYAAIRKQWDYLALTCVLGLYVTAAAVMASILTLAQMF
jgi:hypothetical protein